MDKPEQYPSADIKPRIVGFVCNWNPFSGVEMAGVNRREYPAGIRLVKVTCLGRLHLGLMLKAFELGVDGVMLLGCPSPECHYGSGMEQARELFTQARKTLRLLGIDPQRLDLIEVPLGRDDVLVKRVSAFVELLEGLSLAN